LVLALRGFNAPNDVAWARRVFRFSLIVLLTLSATLAATSLLA
jgi:heme O synthase-like polyprenyltransferase